MANAYKVLAQANPNATTITTLYTVPGATSAVVSSISLCNRGAVAIRVRVSIHIAGAGADDKQYLYYDTQIPANDTLLATLGLTLATTDVVKVYTDIATLSAQLFGAEVT